MNDLNNKISHKNDMLLRLHHLHYDSWRGITDQHSKKALDMYVAMVTTHNLIMRKIKKCNRRYHKTQQEA